MKKSLLTLILCSVASVLAAQPAAAATSLSKCAKISKPGSYIVTKAITAPAGSPSSACFLITIDNVTIDLDGYTVTGQGTGYGIATDDYRANIIVRNGGVRNFEYGLYLFGTQFQVDHINASNNVNTGIWVLSAGTAMTALVSNNLASENGQFGIHTRGGTVLANNVANENAFYGISAYDGNLVGNIAINNTVGNITTSGASTTYNNNPAP